MSRFSKKLALLCAVGTLSLSLTGCHGSKGLPEFIYSKADFNDEDGIELAELEGEFMEMDGWNAETDAEILLNGRCDNSKIRKK